MIQVVLKKKLMGSEGNIDLQFEMQTQNQAIVGIMGPSGAGKTSVLKMLAGLLLPDGGSISVEEVQWYSRAQSISLPPQQRSVGFVFQDYALFPNMNVRQNLEYALPHKQQSSIVDEVLHLMNMEKLQHQKPTRLSGGQQQRVALARAVVRRPQLLLLDEPFAALDRQMRDKLQNDLLSLHQQYGCTTVLVSHDVGEIARMADEVIYLDQGQVVRQGSPSQVLPILDKGEISGEVISVNPETGTFIVYANHARGLWQFDLLQGSTVKKGEQVRVAIKQGRITHLDT